MKSALQPVIDTAQLVTDLVSSIKEQAEAKYQDHPDDAILEDLLRSAAGATTYLLMATTGKNLVSLGLKDRSLKPWARKAAVALVVRETFSASLSGMILWRRHKEAVRMLRAYEEEAAIYA
jgi:hypothetical protein